VGIGAPFEAVAPIDWVVSGCPRFVDDVGATAGQLMATNVCQPRFSQSFWVGLVGLATSTGTVAAAGPRDEAAAGFDSTSAPGFLPQPVKQTVRIAAQITQ
jgi:hypothetical protein